MAIHFPNLEQIMLQSGFDKETVDTALAWLDSSKERDMALLQKLTVQDSKTALNVQKYTPGYRTAFKQDVLPLGSEELSRRFILMSYQLLNAEAYLLTLLLYLLPDINSETYTKLIGDTMQEVWGEDAQARVFSVRYAECTEHPGILYANLPTESAPYLKAAEQTSDKYYVIKLMLCANALEYIPLPEDNKLSEGAQRAVSMIKALLQTGIPEDDVSLLTALAPASLFDAQLKAHFHQYAAAKAGDIRKQTERYMKHPARALDALFSVEGSLTQEVLWDILRLRNGMEMTLQSAAKWQTEAFKSLMPQQRNVSDMAKMNDALKAVKPDAVMDEGEFRDIAKRKTADAAASCFADQDKIRAYINGDIPFDDVWPIVKSTKLDHHTPAKCNYIKYFGEDDFILRCIAVLGGSVGRFSDHLEDVAGYGRDHIATIADKLLGVGLHIVQALDVCGNMSEQYSPFSSDKEKYIDSFSGHTDEIAAADITKCNAAQKSLRCIYLQMMRTNTAGKFCRLQETVRKR